MPNTLAGGSIVVDGFLVYYLDENEVSRLSVPLEYTRQPIASIAITGFGTTNEQATQDKLKMTAALESGAIESMLSLANTSSVEPSMKTFALQVASAGFVVVCALTVGASVVRYRKSRAAFISLLLILGELVIALWFLSFESSSMGIKPVVTINLVYAISLAGVLAGMQFVLLSEKIVKSRDMILRIGYKKLVGAQTFLYLLSVAVSIVAATIFGASFGVFLFSSIIIDWALVRGISEKFVKEI